MVRQATPDVIDRRILGALQADGRRTFAEIAADVSLSAPSVHERVRKLEQRGAIRGYHAFVDPAQVGLGILAFVAVIQDSRADWSELAGEFAAIPEIIDCHHVAGEEDFLLAVRAADTSHLERVLNRIQSTDQVDTTRTTIV
ncbi:MAG TPA: Lrp/AsnC family transcriptional regulator, partial [Candidatus Limnocylindrales bacterium]